jgi:hypothetical protein
MKTNDDSANHPADGLPRCATTKAAAAGQWSNAAQPKLKFKYFQFLPTLNFTTEKIKPEITHMKQNLIPLLAALLLQGAIVTHAATNDAPPVAVTAANNVLTVAVFDFESKDEAVRDLGPKVATLLNANLSASPSVITVERQELEKALGEQELGLSGTVSADTAAKVGQLTGAKVLVTGRVFKVENQTLIVAKSHRHRNQPRLWRNGARRIVGFDRGSFRQAGGEDRGRGRGKRRNPGGQSADA